VLLGLLFGVLDYFLPLPFHGTVKTQVDEWKQTIDRRVFGEITAQRDQGVFTWHVSVPRLTIGDQGGVTNV
jgi:hypothetical protein